MLRAQFIEDPLRIKTIAGAEARTLRPGTMAIAAAAISAKRSPWAQPPKKQDGPASAARASIFAAYQKLGTAASTDSAPNGALTRPLSLKKSRREG